MGNTWRKETCSFQGALAAGHWPCLWDRSGEGHSPLLSGLEALKARAFPPFPGKSAKHSRRAVSQRENLLLELPCLCWLQLPNCLLDFRIKAKWRKRAGGFLYSRKEMQSVVLKAHKHFHLSSEGHVSNEQQAKVLSKAETLDLTPCLAHGTHSRSWTLKVTILWEVICHEMLGYWGIVWWFTSLPQHFTMKFLKNGELLKKFYSGHYLEFTNSIWLHLLYHLRVLLLMRRSSFVSLKIALLK